MLAAETGTAPESLCFAVSEHGKPRLPQFPDLHFNLSHSAGVALAVIDRAGPVGCDIERCLAANADAAVGERLFSLKERADLSGLSEAAWQHGFFTAWVRKEAYVKALGTGLSTPLHDFTVTLLPDEPARLVDGVPGWQIDAVAAPAGYKAAVAYRV